MQVIINLLSNAIKFSSYNGKVTLLAVIDDHNNKLIVSVKDQGVGIEDCNKDRLFKLFGCIQDEKK